MSSSHTYNPKRKALALTFPRAVPRERTRLYCPHCDTPALIRTSEQVTKLTRRSFYSCLNFECGHTFCAMTEIVYTVAPSATPNPSVNLPISNHVRRKMVIAALAQGRTAEHSPRHTRAVTGDLFEACSTPPE